MKLSATVALAFILGVMNTANAASARKAVFAGAASSTGWINFDYQDGKRIFIPARINGHETEVLLATGLPVSDIDKSFAVSIGLQPVAESNAVHGGVKAAGIIHSLDIQIGNLTLKDTVASAVDFGSLAKHLGHPLPLMLGDDVFNNLAVDIDFAHHRIAFSDPTRQTKPAGATEVPLTLVDDIPLVPVSIEDAPPAQFEMGIGNSGDLLVYPSYYDSHKLLQGRRLSTRLAIGSGGINPEPIGTLSRVGFAGFTFHTMPAAFIPANLTGTTSDVIAGDLGLPVLARFRLVIDYSHHRLYATPVGEVTQTPFAKDRLGLWLDKDAGAVVVEFVAPHSPAQAAGFKVGDKIALIDGKPAQEWPQTTLADLRYGAEGTSLAFTLQNDDVRRVKLADYY